MAALAPRRNSSRYTFSVVRMFWPTRCAMYSIGIPALDRSEANCAAVLAVSALHRVEPGVNRLRCRGADVPQASEDIADVLRRVWLSVSLTRVLSLGRSVGLVDDVVARERPGGVTS
jgi:hypothetical protein